MKRSQESSANAIFSLSNLHCSTAPRLIEHGLTQLVGVMDVDVNNVADTFFVEFDPSEITSDVIKDYLKKLCHKTAR